MKKTTLLFAMAILALTFSVNAAVITVSNNQDSPGQYTALQGAIDAANPGDTIYVAGSPTSYGNVTVGKQLVLIGAGYNVHNQYGFITEVGNMKLDNAAASGTVIMGFDAAIIQGYADAINNVVIKRNRCGVYFYNGSAYSYDNWKIYNNIIDNTINSWTSSNPTPTNLYIENNIFTEYGRIYSFVENSTYISNNIILNHAGPTSVFSGLKNVIITNNIFYGTSTTGCDYCTFNNNLSSGGTNLTFSYASNNSANNIEDLNPQFVDVQGYTFDFAYDYHLGDASPGKNAGLDGTDIGIYGGNYPFPSGGDQPWQTSAMPAIPQVDTINITNAVVPVGGTLSVKLKARSNQ